MIQPVADGDAGPEFVLCYLEAPGVERPECVPGSPGLLPEAFCPVRGFRWARARGRFRVKARWHNDRWQPAPLMPWADDAAARLAVISGSTTAAIKNALPAFGVSRGQPVRAVTACRLCTAARRISQPVPVHLPAHHQVCLRHGIWLSGPGTPQFSVSGCPDILAAERQARRILRLCTIAQLIFSKIQATAGEDDHALETPDASPHRVQPPASDRIERAGTVPGRGLPPEAIAAAACARETNGCGEKGN